MVPRGIMRRVGQNIAIYSKDFCKGPEYKNIIMSIRYLMNVLFLEFSGLFSVLFKIESFILYSRTNTATLSPSIV